jgi:hypothetical protein
MTASVTQTSGAIRRLPAFNNLVRVAITTVYGDDLIVVQVKPDAGGTTVASVAFSGSTFNSAGTSSGISTFWLPAPAVANGFVDVDLSTFDAADFSVFVISGGHQTAPLGTVVSAAGTSTAPATGSVACPAGGLVIGMQSAGYTASGTPTAGSGCTLGFAGRDGGSGQTTSGAWRATTGAISFSIGGAASWAAAAYPVNAASGGGGGGGGARGAAAQIYSQLIGLSHV